MDEIYLDALEIADASARANYLERACSGDVELRRRIEAMLADAANADRFFGPMDGPSSGHPSSIDQPGAIIGRYKLLQKIGEGGMGVVYMAEQREPVVRKVALKIIKAGMDTRQVIARFEAERQALALMDHPNISKVLDGGETGNGRPYFVMDLVQGLPITQFCDEAKLSTRERLELLLDVCSAIQHAHQKGVIHRDIKPSNILVTLHGDKAVPRVIDFGIAKATQQPLTDKTLFTQFQHFIGTPAYMSPEQASLSGLDIDTRSDIYALGVLLYELLTGKTPFDGNELLKSGLDEMCRTIREKEPPRPSTRLRMLASGELTTTAQRRRIQGPRLINTLRGDLDWVAMKCIEKDRARRYESANGVASDVRRYLNSEAVVARPPSRIYQIQKTIRRNRVGSITAIIVLLCLVFTLIVTSTSYRREHAARSEAELRRREAEAARDGEENQRRAAEANALRARRSLYAADMLLAQQALDENNCGNARERLSSHIPKMGEPDLRGWEWSYLWDQSRSGALYELGGHENTVFALAISRDGRLLASLGYDQMLRLFNLNERREVGRFRTNRDHPLPRVRDDFASLEFSPRGDVLGISGSRSGLTLLRIPSLQPIHESALAMTNKVLSFGFDGEGEECLLATPGNLLRFDGKAGKLLDSEIVPFAWTAKLSPDGRYLVFGKTGGTEHRHRVGIWDRQQKKEIAVWDQDQWWGNTSVAFSPDGQWAVVGGQTVDEKGLVVLFDLAGQREQWRVEGLGTWVSGVSFSPDSKILATASTDHLVRLWRVEARDELTRLRGHRDEPWAVTFSIDAETLFVGEKRGALTAWSTHPQSRHAARHAVSPDLLWWRISKNGQSLLTVSSNGWAQFWSNVSNAPSSFNLRGTNLSAMDISSDGSVLAIAQSRGPVELWDPAAGVCLKELTAPAQVKRLAISDDGRRLAGMFVKDVNLWDPDTGECVSRIYLRLKHAAVLALDHDATRLAVGSFEGELEVWDLIRQQRLFIAATHNHEITSLAFSPDGNQLASAGTDARIKISDVASGTVLTALEAHRNTLDSVAYSSDGRRLVAAGPNGEVYLFETGQFQPVGRLKLEARSPCSAWLTQESVDLIVTSASSFQVLSVSRTAQK